VARLAGQRLAGSTSGDDGHTYIFPLAGRLRKSCRQLGCVFFFFFGWVWLA